MVVERDAAGEGVLAGGVAEEVFDEGGDFGGGDHFPAGGFGWLGEVGAVEGGFGALHVLAEDDEAGGDLFSLRGGDFGGVAAGFLGGEFGAAGGSVFVRGEGEVGGGAASEAEGDGGQGFRGGDAVDGEAEADGFSEREIRGIGPQAVAFDGGDVAVGEQPEGELVPEAVVGVVVVIGLRVEDPAPEISDSEGEGLPVAEAAIDDGGGVVLGD